MTIRPARPDELALIADVESDSDRTFAGTDLDWIAGGEPTPQTVLAPLFEAGAIFVSANEADAPTGFVACAIRGDLLVIVQLSVRRSCQKRGLGRRLMEAAAQEARRRGLNKIGLTTYRDVAFNGPFYGGLGYVELDGTAIPPTLAGMLDHEAAMGHDPARRCAMVLTLAPA